MIRGSSFSFVSDVIVSFGLDYSELSESNSFIVESSVVSLTTSEFCESSMSSDWTISLSFTVCTSDISFTTDSPLLSKGLISASIETFSFP